MEFKLASKSEKQIGRICSMGVWRRASPRLRSGPMAASFASAVISEPENPIYNEINQSPVLYLSWEVNWCLTFCNVNENFNVLVIEIMDLMTQ